MSENVQVRAEVAEECNHVVEEGIAALNKVRDASMPVIAVLTGDFSNGEMNAVCYPNPQCVSVLLLSTLESVLQADEDGTIAAAVEEAVAKARRH